MSFVESRRSPSVGSMAAVLAIHGAVGAALIFGLTVSGVIKQDGGIVAIPIAKPPPPEPPKPEQADRKPQDTKIHVPAPPIPIPLPQPPLDTIKAFPPPQPPLQPGSGTGIATPIPLPVPSFSLIGAKPRNDPKNWVTTEDYRSNWIRQEMTGRASFRLEIAADGRVTGCEVTATTGHEELDRATCALIQRRARFQPGRGTEGEPVPGSYSGTIDWRLPE